MRPTESEFGIGKPCRRHVRGALLCILFELECINLIPICVRPKDLGFGLDGEELTHGSHWNEESRRDLGFWLDEESCWDLLSREKEKSFCSRFEMMEYWELGHALNS